MENSNLFDQRMSHHNLEKGSAGRFNGEKKELHDINPISPAQSAWALRQFEPKLTKALRHEEDKRDFFYWFDQDTLRENIEIFRLYLCDASAHYDDLSSQYEAAGDVRDELIEVIEVIENKWGRAASRLEEEENHAYWTDEARHQYDHMP